MMNQQAIGKARAPFITMKHIWRSHLLTTGTTIDLFNSNIMPVRLYGAETRTTTKTNNQHHPSGPGRECPEEEKTRKTKEDMVEKLGG